MKIRNTKPVFPFFVILYMKRKVMDMSTNNQIEQNCFICKKHKGNIIVPGGAIYEDELVYVGHVHWDSEET